MSNFDTDKSSLTLDRFNEIDAGTRYKVAMKEENESTTLLTFYRDRINAFDKERHEWLQKLDQMAATKDENYQEAWELQKKREALGDLQRSISEAKLSTHGERQQVLKLKRENDELKLRELENRKKIYELMVLNEPGEKENTFYRDLRPDVKKTMKNDLSIHLNKKGGQTQGFTGTQTHGKTGRDVLKTIYLPNEQINTVAVENENLKRRIEEETVASAEYLEALREELRVREEELTQRQEVDIEKLRDISEKNRLLESYKSALAREYFTFRLEVKERKEKLLNENELLRMKNESLNQKLQEHDRRVEVENKVAQEMLEKKAEEYSEKYRSRIRNKDETLFVVKDQYAHVQKTYLNKLKAIEENLSQLANKYQTLDQRRMLENEEFKAQVKDLEKRVKQFERNYFEGGLGKTLGKDKAKLTFVPRQEYENENIDNKQDIDEDDEEAQTLNSEEFSLIRHQLAELESKLDKQRKREDFY